MAQRIRIRLLWLPGHQHLRLHVGGNLVGELRQESDLDAAAELQFQLTTGDHVYLLEGVWNDGYGNTPVEQRGLLRVGGSGAPRVEDRRPPWVAATTPARSDRRRERRAAEQTSPPELAAIVYIPEGDGDVLLAAGGSTDDWCLHPLP